MRLFHYFVVLLPLVVSQSFAQIRKVAVKEDSILTVKTALGIATIIQVPETIQSAIIGDQSGFKVEYLDRAVTIKPLRWGAKTNLYLVTDKRRHNLRLQTGAQEAADYIVYVQNPERPKPTTKWARINKATSQGELKFTVERIGFTSGGFILLDCSLSTKASHSLQVKPNEIWVKQNNQSRTINSLFLSDVKVDKKTPLKIGVSLAKSDLLIGKPITVEIQNQRTLSINLTESLWK